MTHQKGVRCLLSLRLTRKIWKMSNLIVTHQKGLKDITFHRDSPERSERWLASSWAHTRSSCRSSRCRCDIDESRCTPGRTGGSASSGRRCRSPGAGGACTAPGCCSPCRRCGTPPPPALHTYTHSVGLVHSLRISYTSLWDFISGAWGCVHAWDPAQRISSSLNRSPGVGQCQFFTESLTKCRTVSVLHWITYPLSDSVSSSLNHSSSVEQCQFFTESSTSVGQCQLFSESLTQCRTVSALQWITHPVSNSVSSSLNHSPSVGKCHFFTESLTQCRTVSVLHWSIHPVSDSVSSSLNHSCGESVCNSWVMKYTRNSVQWLLRIIVRLYVF